MTTYGESQRKVKENVLSILEEYEPARNSDKHLLLKYWSTYDNIDVNHGFATQFAVRGTSPESITRARRSIQSGGLYPPTEPEVLRQRRMLAEEARVHHVTN
jgi:hypothetical protein